MTTYNFNFGFDMVFTAQIPPKVMKYIETKGQGAVAGVDLTPSFGVVPSLLVADIRASGIDTPEHWADTNEVVPIIHGVAFYLTPQFSTGMAASFSMKGVNLRTGRVEGDLLTDDPCQSYWASCPRWIDGYVPSHQRGVRQFLPLRGETEMAGDVANFIAVSTDNPWLDAISAAFYLPHDMRQMIPKKLYRHAYQAMGLESFSPSPGEKGILTRGSQRNSAPEAVGMGAGAIMKQRHPDDPTVHAKDFFPTSFIRTTTRMVWVDWWNLAAEKVGKDQLKVTDQRVLHDMQRRYERNLWSQLNFTAETDVDSFPTP